MWRRQLNKKDRELLLDISRELVVIDTRLQELYMMVDGQNKVIAQAAEVMRLLDVPALRQVVERERRRIDANVDLQFGSNVHN